MKNATEHAKSLSQLLSRVAPAEPDTAAQQSPVERLIFAFLAWEATHTKAQHAYGRLMNQAVDFNDLRVSDPSDIAAVIGANYPRSLERGQRLRSTLNAIYRREHAVDLSALAEKPKREVRAYLDSLEGMVPFVSASVTLLAFGGHAIPLDEQLYRRLAGDGVVEPTATFEETQAFLDHHIRFEDAVEAHAKLRAYVEQSIRFEAAAPRKRPTKKASTKKSKKPTKKAGAGR